MNESAAITAAQAGDPAALEQLLRDHYDRMFALAMRLLGDRSDAEDATQEALLAVVRGLHRFDGRAAFGTWVYRVTANTCLDELRRRKRRPATTELAHEPASASDRGPEPAVVDRLDVNAALARLPDDFRTAVVLRDLCDLEYAEISETLAIPPGTVRSRIARGRSMLAGLLGAGNPTDAGERRTEVP